MFNTFIKILVNTGLGIKTLKESKIKTHIINIFFSLSLKFMCVIYISNAYSYKKTPDIRAKQAQLEPKVFGQTYFE